MTVGEPHCCTSLRQVNRVDGVQLHKWLNTLVCRFATQPTQSHAELTAPSMRGGRVPDHRWLFGDPSSKGDQIYSRLWPTTKLPPAGASGGRDGASWTDVQRCFLHELCALAAGDEAFRRKRSLTFPSREGSQQRADAALARELHALFSSHTAEQVLAEVVRYFDGPASGSDTIPTQAKED